MPLDPSFAPMIQPFDPSTLDAASATICAVDADFRIRYVNPAWSVFAQANGATWKKGEWGVGARMFDAIPRVLCTYYEILFQRVLDTRVPAEHTYECSSPLLFRRFRMRVLPCERAALVLEHSLLVEIAHDAPDDALVARYRTSHDLVIQCAHCRRVRRAEAGQVHWDWVPDLAAATRMGTSHALCEVCREFYFPS